MSDNSDNNKEIVREKIFYQKKIVEKVDRIDNLDTLICVHSFISGMLSVKKKQEED